MLTEAPVWVMNAFVPTGMMASSVRTVSYCDLTFRLTGTPPFDISGTDAFDSF